MTHIIFGSGPLGRATAAALLAQGRDVTIASRSGAMTDTPAGARLIALNLNDTEAATAACQDASALYFCAAPAYHRWAQDFPPMLSAAIAIAAATGARLVVADNLYGYGKPLSPMVETMPLKPHTRKGRVRASMHAMVEVAHAEGRIDFAVARGSDFFGPFVADSAVGARLFNSILRGQTALLMGDLDQLHTYTFVQDFGAALAILGTDERAVNQVWHVPNAPAVTTRRFVEIAARLADKPARMRAMTMLEVRVIGAFVPPLREAIEMLYEFEAPFVVDHNKFVAVFGDISTPLEAALETTLQHARGNA